MSPKKPQIEKRDLLLKAAEELFNRFGIRKVTVEEICKTAGVSKMTFYKYFKNKIEIAKAMLDLIYDESYKKMDDIDAQPIPFSEKIKLFLKLKEEYVNRFGKDFLMDYVAMIPEMQEWFQKMANEAYQRVIVVIQNAQDKGEVRKDMKPAFIIAMLNNMMELVKNKELVDLYPDYTDFVMEVNNFFYYGILPKRD